VRYLAHPRARLAVLAAVMAGALGLAGVIAGGSADLGRTPTAKAVRTATPAAVRARAAQTKPRSLPRPWQIRAGRRYAAAREGNVSFAVVTTTGRVTGHRAGVQYRSASLSKAMILVAYLRRIAHEAVSATAHATLSAMIRRSDNDAATALYTFMGGDAALVAVAHAAGMSNFGPAGFWSEARVTAADQARLFARLDELLPPRHRAYARNLLRTIVAAQSWGIPRAARPRGFRVLFKGGWRRSKADGDLVNQAARLERGTVNLAIAVLTDGNPSHAYGTETVRGITARLLPVGGRS